MRIICLFLFVTVTFAVQAQTPAAGQTQPPIPSREEFLNKAIISMHYGSKDTLYYYLLAGTDTCRFEKFDYDEWVKYYLKEPAPLVAMNELAYKAHMARDPYYWQQDKLHKAICISAKMADSLVALPFGQNRTLIFSVSQPFFTDDGLYAVMDINNIGKPGSGGGMTFFYKHKQDGWHTIGAKQNWGADH